MSKSESNLTSKWAEAWLYIEELDKDIVSHRKTIKANKWTHSLDFKNWYYHSPEEILNDPDFKEEVEWEEAGRYRTHQIKLDKTQTALKNYFMKFNIVALLSIKLPSKSSCKMTRVKKEKNALEKYRRIIREIQRSYLGCSHWEKHPAFDFVLTMEHGEKNIWHCHLGIIPLEDDNEKLFMYKLYYACKTVNKKYGFGKKVINLEPVFDKEGMCTYLVKEIKEKEQLDPNNTHLSMYYTMYSLFHVGPQNKLRKLLNVMKVALARKRKGTLHIPNPINKLAGRIYRIFRK